ncbi:MAG: hypothetical protein ACRDTD_32570, partial [Pseudonocardiaceae bacterium]
RQSIGGPGLLPDVLLSHWHYTLIGFWAFAVVLTALSAIRAAAALARARRGGDVAQVAERTEDAKCAGIAFGQISVLGGVAVLAVTNLS